MRLLKRNLTSFEYRPYKDAAERLNGERHTGERYPEYGDPVIYEGQINAPTGYAIYQQYGVETRYMYVVTLADPDADIKENGQITWKGEKYEIRDVRRSLNYLACTMRKVNRNNAVTRP